MAFDILCLDDARTIRRVPVGLLQDTQVHSLLPSSLCFPTMGGLPSFLFYSSKPFPQDCPDSTQSSGDSQLSIVAPYRPQPFLYGCRECHATCSTYSCTECSHFLCTSCAIRNAWPYDHTASHTVGPIANRVILAAVRPFAVSIQMDVFKELVRLLRPS